MQIVADENIPLASELFGSLGDVIAAPGRAIGPDMLQNADVLLVRSVTRVDASLLTDTPVQFVGSATSGSDHVDVEYLSAHGIGFAHAPGANAESVVEYVLAAMILLAVRRQEPLAGKTAGIVGCGSIGGELARRLSSLGMDVLRCDPPLAEKSGREYVPLKDLLRASDVVTLHTPLTADGPHATRHLVDADALDAMKPAAWLLNTSRGGVVDNAALIDTLAEGRPAAAVLDVWENEPSPHLDLVRLAAIATPHIAGYSYDGKVAGTRMLCRAVCEHFGIGLNPDDPDGTAAKLPLSPPDPALPLCEALGILTSQMYDLAGDDRKMRRLTRLSSSECASAFTDLRKRYPRRRSFGAFTLHPAVISDTMRAPLSAGLKITVHPRHHEYP